MTDFEGSIPVGMISICDLFEAVYQAITPDRQTLEERLNPSSPHDGADQNQHNQHVKDLAYREAKRSYDQSRLRAGERLREKLVQGALIARFEDPKKDRDRQISLRRWASMGSVKTLSDEQLLAIVAGADAGAIEAMGVFETGIILIDGERRQVFFDWKDAESVLSEIQQLASTTGTPDVKNKGGRPPDYAWDKVEPLVFQELAVHGKPGPNNKRFPSKTQLVEFVQIELGKFDEHPTDTAVMYHVNRWLAEFDKN